MRKRWLFVGVLCAVVMAGCGKDKEAENAATAPPAGTAPAMQQGATPGGGAAGSSYQSSGMPQDVKNQMQQRGAPIR